LRRGPNASLLEQATDRLDDLRAFEGERRLLSERCSQLQRAEAEAKLLLAEQQHELERARQQSALRDEKLQLALDDKQSYAALLDDAVHEIE
jgi:hypothetical protein